MSVGRRSLFSLFLSVLLVVPVFSQAAPGSAANAAETSQQIQQHIDHVTSGLTTPVIDKNDPHPGKTLSAEMAALQWSARLEMCQWRRETLDKESIWDEVRSTSLSRW